VGRSGRGWIGSAPSVQKGLRRIQVEAINRIEGSMVHNHPRALAQMATGSGKTFMAANLAYRLVQTAGAERVLFLVDRANLGRQTLREFQQFATPGDGRRFTDLYNVQLLSLPAPQGTAGPDARNEEPSPRPSPDQRRATTGSRPSTPQPVSPGSGPK